MNIKLLKTLPAAFVVLGICTFSSAQNVPVPDPATQLVDALESKGLDGALLNQGQSLAPTLNESQKQRLRQALATAVEKGSTTVRQLAPTQLVTYGRLQQHLGVDPSAIDQALLSWAQPGNTWEQLDPVVEGQSLSWLMQRFTTSPIPDCQSTADAMSRWLVTQAKGADYLKLARMGLLYGPALKEAHRRSLATQLVQTLQAAEKAEGLVSSEKLTEVGWALVMLQQGEAAAMLVFDRIERQPNCLIDNQFSLLAPVTGALNLPTLSEKTRHKLLMTVLPSMVQRLAAKDPQATALELIVRWLVDVREVDQAKKLTTDLYRQLLVSNRDYSKLTVVDLFWLSVCLMRCDEQHEGKLYEGWPNFGKALAQHLSEVPKWERIQGEYLCYVVLSAPLASREDQAAIEAKEESPLMEERVAALKLTGVVRKMQGRLEEWQKELDKRVREKRFSELPDRQAELLVARAFAHEIEVWDRASLSGRQYLDQAFAKAKSEPTKLLCIRSLVYRICKAGEFETAASFLESVEGQVQDKSSVEAIALLRYYVSEQRGSRDRLLAMQEKQRSRARLEGQAQLLERQLEISRKRKRNAAILASLEKQIQETQTQIAALR